MMMMIDYERERSIGKGKGFERVVFETSKDER